MSLRLALVALLSLATPSFAGEHLLVAGADGSVYRTDPGNPAGFFEYFTCACTGPVKALAADRTNLYVADEFGRLLVSDVRSGVPKTLVTLSVGEISALVATPSGLFVGSPSGVVARVDPATGVTLDERLAPAGVRALATLNGHLFAATSDNAIYRAPLDAGEFTYFSCFCFFDLKVLVADGNDLLAGDGSGIVIRVDGTEGWVLSAQWTTPMNAMAARPGEFLVHTTGGLIGRFDQATGAALGKLDAPFDVRAMLIVKDAPLPVALPKAPKAAKHP